VSAGANVISMSLGGGTKSRTEETAFNNAWNNGVLSVAAAGNGGNSQMSYPASYSVVMSVGALDKNKQIASF
jgi:subtilisin family serine protease